MKPNDNGRNGNEHRGDVHRVHHGPSASGLTEDELDLVFEVIARRAFERMDPMDPRHERFIEWQARDARARLSPAERRALERSARVFAEHVLRCAAAERAAERARVRRVNEAPPVSPYVPDRVVEGYEVVVDGDPRRGRIAPAWDLAVAAGVGRDLWDEPPGHWVALPHDVGDGRYVALTVAGDSMAPLLHTGDTILVRLGPELAADQVVVARHPDGGYVVKRVGRVDPMRVELTSLNDAYEPLQIPNDAALILGTVVLRWCPHDGARLPH